MILGTHVRIISIKIRETTLAKTHDFDRYEKATLMFWKASRFTLGSEPAQPLDGFDGIFPQMADFGITVSLKFPFS